jgi:hypothetical protein
LLIDIEEKIAVLACLVPMLAWLSAIFPREKQDSDCVQVKQGTFFALVRE